MKITVFPLSLLAALSLVTELAAPGQAQLLDFQIMQYPASAHMATASGTGVVYAVPDRAVVVLSVRCWDKNLRAAYSQNSNNSQKVLSLAAKYHIEAKNLQTSEIIIEPTYPEQSGGTTATQATKANGYKVERRIAFQLNGTKDLAALIADAIDAGANTLQSVTLETSNLRKLKDEARLLAVRAAREKAEAMASELKAKLGRALIVKETGSAVSDLDSSTRWVNTMANLEALTGRSSASETQDSFAPGQLAISSSATVTFELGE